MPESANAVSNAASHALAFLIDPSSVHANLRLKAGVSAAVESQ
jgi:hypothetical protein